MKDKLIDVEKAWEEYKEAARYATFAFEGQTAECGRHARKNASKAFDHYEKLKKEAKKSGR